VHCEEVRSPTRTDLRSASLTTGTQPYIDGNLRCFFHLNSRITSCLMKSLRAGRFPPLSMPTEFYPYVSYCDTSLMDFQNGVDKSRKAVKQVRHLLNLESPLSQSKAQKLHTSFDDPLNPAIPSPYSPASLAPPYPHRIMNANLRNAEPVLPSDSASPGEDSLARFGAYREFDSLCRVSDICLPLHS
jgi:hypothetical protein